jgi:hypothetical protein
MGFFPKKITIGREIHYIALRDCAEGLKAITLWTDTDPQRVKGDINTWSMSIKEKLKMCLISTLITEGWNAETSQICRQINTMYLQDIKISNSSKLIEFMNEKYPDAILTGMDRLSFDSEGLPTPASVTNLWCVPKGIPWYLTAATAIFLAGSAMSLTSADGIQLANDREVLLHVLDCLVGSPLWEELFKRWTIRGYNVGMILPYVEFLGRWVANDRRFPFYAIPAFCMHFVTRNQAYWKGVLTHSFFNYFALSTNPEFRSWLLRYVFQDKHSTT